MEKNRYTLFLASAFLGLCSFAQNGRQPVSCQQKVQPLSQMVSLASNRANVPLEELVIVDEDFSGLTKGTEDQPDTTPLLDEKDGYFKDNSLLKPYASSCTRTWGGMGAFSAGGCIAMVNGGFLNTPTGDYQGSLRMTCRLKLVPGQDVSDTSLDLILLRRSVIHQYKKKTVYLTDEWQEVTFEADNGHYEDMMIQFFTMSNFSYLIDDVKIVHTINSIGTPGIIEPFTVADNKFVARWTKIPQATDYLLSVYTKKDNPEVQTIKEGFDEIKSMDGKFVNEMNANYPKGWKVNVAQFGDKRHLFTEEGYYSSGKQSVCLDAKGDFIESPELKYPMKEMNLWVKVDDSEQPANKPYSSLIEVYALTKTGWTRWVEISIEAIRNLENSMAIVELSQHISALDAIYGVRIGLAYEEGDECRIGIDDVHLAAPALPIKEFIFEDKAVVSESDGEINSCEVVVDNPDLTYFYYVKAKNDQFTSEASEEMEVFDVHEPVALPATDVKADGYTAHWECGPKVDFFRFDQLLSKTIKEDQDEYVVLEEDFSKVVSDGTPENPKIGQYTDSYVSLDAYTHMSGWSATSYSLANGMVGGMVETFPYYAGAVRTPKMDLSRNKGMCKVAFRIYGEEGDNVVISGVNPYATTNSIYFEKTGFVEDTLDLSMCSREEVLTFYSGNWKPFMIDYIKILQPVKAGDVLKFYTYSSETSDVDERSLVRENVERLEGYDMYYQVTAFRYYHGNLNNIWQSAPSNAILVSAPTAIGQVAQEEGLKVYSEANGLNVELTENSLIQVYDISGRLLKTVDGQTGNNHITLADKSLYIVRVGSFSKKVAVY